MLGFRINKLFIENFKLIDKALIDFDNMDIIVMDGPNGFGKTTVFDSIELIMTQKINRIKNNITSKKSQGFNQLPYHKDPNNDLILVAELLNREGTTISIIRRLRCKVNDSKKRRPEYFEDFELYQHRGSILNEVKDNIEHTGEQGNNLTEAYSAWTKNIIDIKQDNDVEFIIDDEVIKFYNNFYYIEQEDNTYYLKKQEDDRMDEINSLFSTEKQGIEQKKLEAFSERVRLEYRNLTKQIRSKKEKINQIEIKLVNSSGNEEYKFQKLLDFAGIEKVWDKEDIVITDINKPIIDNEINNLENFVIYFPDYQNQGYNKKFEKYFGEIEIVRNTIILGYWLKDNEKRYKEVIDKNSKFKQNNVFINYFQKANILTKVDDTVINDLKNEHGEKYDYSAIKSIIDSIKLKKEGASSISNVIHKLNDTRKSLTKSFEEAINKVGIDNKFCPLCGQPWENYEELIEVIDKKKKEFELYFDNTTKEYEIERDNLFDQYIDTILDDLKKYVENKDNIIDENFYMQISEAYKKKDEVQSLLKWSSDNSIDISQYLNKIEVKYTLTFGAYEQFYKEISKYKRDLSKEFKNIEKLHISLLTALYKDCFANKINNVKSVTLEQIKNKKSYIENQYFNAKYKEISNLKKDLKEAEKKLNILKEWTVGGKVEDTKKALPLQKIIDVYEEEIMKRHKKLIKDVEIPFYIFSGKIMQTYQRGMGVFLNTGDSGGTKTIRFVCDSKNNHDAINYMSSGQLSGVVIAWTLALNKVYSEKNNFNTILIDDPVQTMDDINMASLVDLLRNDFSDRQLIISTHEDDVSRYIRYKFKKNGLSEKGINVKNELY